MAIFRHLIASFITLLKVTHNISVDQLPCLDAVKPLCFFLDFPLEPIPIISVVLCRKLTYLAYLDLNFLKGLIWVSVETSMEEASNTIPEEGSDNQASPKPVFSKGSDRDTTSGIANKLSQTADDICKCPDAVRDLESCNWDQLQEKFVRAMEAHARNEQDLQEQAAQLIGVFCTCLWSDWDDIY